MDYKKLGNILKTARVQLNINLRDTAFTLHTHPTCIEDLERGVCNISLSEYIKICDEYGIDPAEVLKECYLQETDQNDTAIDARLSRISECFHATDERYQEILLELAECLSARHPKQK